MRTRRGIILFLSCAALAAAGSAGLLLASDRGEERGSEDREGSDLMEVLEVVTEGFVSPADAVVKALEATPGRALDVELAVHGAGDRRVVTWEVEVLGEKGIRHVYLDAAGGGLIASEAEDEEDENEEAEELRDLLEGCSVDLASALAAVGKSVEGVILGAEIEEEDMRRPGRSSSPAAGTPRSSR